MDRLSQLDLDAAVCRFDPDGRTTAVEARFEAPAGTIVSSFRSRAWIPPFDTRAEIVARASAGIRSVMPPFIIIEGDAVAGDLRDVHVDAAIGGARVDGTRHVARGDRAIQSSRP